MGACRAIEDTLAGLAYGVDPRFGSYCDINMTVHHCLSVDSLQDRASLQFTSEANEHLKHR